MTGAREGGRGAGGTGRTLTALPGLQVGHAHDRSARTGCTAVVGPFRGVVEVRGLATGSREFDALSPLHLVRRCDALLLTGGSAFGLAAADGVTRWLEERGRGFPTPAARVPIVPAAVIYDLSVGDPSVRPGPDMGYAAAEAASGDPLEEGAVGVGCGATVGKLAGPARAEASGVGSWSEVGPEGRVAALAVVNAFGDVVDDGGSVLAGCRAEDGAHLDTARALREGELPEEFGRPPTGENTTLAVVGTDAALDDRGLQIMARQAMNGLVRRVRPAATPFDGDVVFAVGTADPEAPPTEDPRELLPLVARAEWCVERSVQRAVAAGRGEDAA